jgi:hypothetical protein
MAEFWATIVGTFRKIGPIPLTALGLVGALLLFSPNPWLLKLGVDVLVDEHRSWIGLASLAVWALLFSHFAWWVRGFAVERIRSNQTHKVCVQLLYELTPDEKVFLVPYIIDDVNSRIAPIENGVVGGLVAKGILFRAAYAAPFGDFPYNMQPWARRYLAEHPQILVGASEEQFSEEYPSRQASRRRW